MNFCSNIEQADEVLREEILYAIKRWPELKLQYTYLLANCLQESGRVCAIEVTAQDRDLPDFERSLRQIFALDHAGTRFSDDEAVHGFWRIHQDSNIKAMGVLCALTFSSIRKWARLTEDTWPGIVINLHPLKTGLIESDFVSYPLYAGQTVTGLSQGTIGRFGLWLEDVRLSHSRLCQELCSLELALRRKGQ